LITENSLGDPIDPPLLNWEPKVNASNPDYAQVLSALYSSDNAAVAVPVTGIVIVTVEGETVSKVLVK
jgi:hypothetical protein